jgi:citrate synthase
MAKVDQRGSNNQHAEFLETAAAAAFLGVQPRTLYAYASRGLVTRVRAGRRSRYARADLERWKARHDARSGHGPVAGAALQWGEPVLATRICGVGPEGPSYRGHAATALAQSTPFLDVCQLLWTGQLAPPPALATPPIIAAAERHATDPILRFMNVALRGLQRASAPFGLAPEVELGRARALVLAFAGVAGPRAASKSTDPARRILDSFGLGGQGNAGQLALVNAALVLCADHELNASTFAARVAASTGADLQACLLAALATFLGPRHGTASLEVEALLDEVPRPARAEAVVRARTTRGQAVPGFGHRLYPDGDPRATALLALVRQAVRRPVPRLRVLDAVIEATARVRGERPNIDTALVAAALAIGLPRGAGAALFAVGRTAGWVAHVLEQRESPTLLRPRARYVGEPPLSPSTARPGWDNPRAR